MAEKKVAGDGSIQNPDQVVIKDMLDAAQSLGFGKRAFGMPPFWNGRADPSGRVYAKTFMSDVLTVTLVPGNPKFNKLAAAQQVSKAIADAMNDEKKLASVLTGNPYKYTDKLATKNPADLTDLRFYSFQPAYAEYFNYVQTMLTYLSAQMFGTLIAGVGSVGSTKKGLDSFNQYNSEAGEYGGLGIGVKFWIEKNSSVTESVSNNFSEPRIAGSVKSASDLVREASFLAGVSADVAALAASGDAVAAGVLKKSQSMAQTNVTSVMQGMAGDILNRAKDGATNVVAGFNVVYPEVWKDSNYGPNYNLNIKLISPYGDAESIFRHVYVPLVALMALSLPRQQTLSGYSAPFILKADCPGWFTSPMCVVTNISWKRGADSDVNWSAGGLPTAIDVDLTIKDLYPIMMIARDYSMLVSNVGIAGFLQNLAGIKMGRPNVFAEATAMLMGNQFVSFVNNVGGRLGGSVSQTMNMAIGELNSAIFGRALFR